jgi:hypothetical protein
MLSCRIDLRDTRADSWRWHDGKLVHGASWVRPVIHSTALVTVSQKADRTRLVIQERDYRDHATDTDMAGVVNGRDQLEVVIGPSSVRFTAGVGGTAPLYLTMADGIVYGSWHLPDLRRHTNTDRLLDRAATRVLTRQLRYSSDTLFQDIVMVTERAAATATPAGITVNLPPAAQHVLAARQPRAGTNVVEAFETLLASAVSRAVPPGMRVGIELSGGVDSANVALTLARHTTAITCFGLLLDDLTAVGGEQGQACRRRHAVVSMLGLPDITVQASKHPPFVPSGIRRCGIAHDPGAAFYREAFDALRDAAAGNVDIMMTGLGGDELLALPATETAARAPRTAPNAKQDTNVPWLGQRARAALADINTNLAPVSVLPLPTLMSFALHNPAYLQAGIWPISPLADPRLLRFGEQLPFVWRRDKTLLRERLRCAGLPSYVYRPRCPETFSPLMQLGLRQHGLDLARHMLSESLLIDTGYIDHAQFAATYEAALGAARIPSLLCDTIALELGLRSLTTHPLRPT